MIVRRAESGEAAALSELAIRTYAAAFGHSFADSDLAAASSATSNSERWKRLPTRRPERAQSFYRRYGFEAIGERRFDVASGAATDPDLVMVRRSPT